VTATLSAEIASALGLAAAGDEAYLEVTKVNEDGSVEVMTEMEAEEPEMESPDMESAKAILKTPAPAAPTA
jgi:hypothetical protein